MSEPVPEAEWPLTNWKSYKGLVWEYVGPAEKDGEPHVNDDGERLQTVRCLGRVTTEEPTVLRDDPEAISSYSVGDTMPVLPIWFGVYATAWSEP